MVGGTNCPKRTSESGLKAARVGYIASTLTKLRRFGWRHNFGPLHTRAKSHDREIVRAQKKVCEGRPNTPPKSCSVVTDPQV